MEKFAQVFALFCLSVGGDVLKAEPCSAGDTTCQVGDDEANAMELTLLQRRGVTGENMDAHADLEKRKVSILSELDSIEEQLSNLQRVDDEPENDDGEDDDEDDSGPPGVGVFHASPNSCCSRRRRGGECATRRRRFDFLPSGHGDKECGICNHGGCSFMHSECPHPEVCVGEPNDQNRPPTCQCDPGPPPCSAQGNLCGRDGHVSHECCPPYGHLPEGTVSECAFKVGRAGDMTCQYKVRAGCKSAGDGCGKFGTMMGHCCDGLQCKDGGSVPGTMTCMSGTAAR